MSLLYNNDWNHYIKVVENVRKKAIECGRSSDDIKVIAVSKTVPLQKMQSVYNDGCRIFGESRIQEALEKTPKMPLDCCWHLIGSLQKNKVGKAVELFDLIHSVDSPELAYKIGNVSLEKNIQSSILLQVNTSGELSKHGLSPIEWEKQLDAIQNYPHLNILGLMTMAPLTEDQQQIRSCFRLLYQLREKWRARMANPSIFQHLSMGMSNDYLIAIEEGATFLRIGSAIFNPH